MGFHYFFQSNLSQFLRLTHRIDPKMTTQDVNQYPVGSPTSKIDSYTRKLARMRKRTGDDVQNSQSNRNVRHNGFRRSGGKREYVPAARAGPNHRGGQGPRYNQRRPQGQSAEGQYRAGTPVDALNMNFQGDRSAFHKTGRSCTINAAYNGKKFKARGVITEAERQRILAQCPPRSAECKAWDNAASVAAIKAFYGSDPYEQKIFRDPVVQRVLRYIDQYPTGSNWADEDESSSDDMNFV